MNKLNTPIPPPIAGILPTANTPFNQNFPPSTNGIATTGYGIPAPIINVNIPPPPPISSQVNDLLGVNPHPTINGVVDTLNQVRNTPGFSDAVNRFGQSLTKGMNNFADLMENGNMGSSFYQQQQDAMNKNFQEQQDKLDQQEKLLEGRIKSAQSQKDQNAISSAPSGPPNEVFHISDNRYTFGEAKAVCRALGAKLATYEQIEQAYKDGADWFNYGWSEGQYAYFPLQVETWKKIQEEVEGGEKSCNNNIAGKLRPGIAGGYFANPNLKFGVNCYGVKPPKRDIDQMAQPHIPLSALDKTMDKRVQYFQNHMDKIRIDSFNSNEWSEY